MDLPGDSIGITDVLAYRECPRRFSFGMRRHVGAGEQSEATTTPESAAYGSVWARAYGSAIHTAIEALEEGADVDRAIQIAWEEYGRFLDPPDVDLLRDDLGIYRHRDFPNTRTVLSEEEIRVPLMKRGGRWIYFRARIDRLYERLDRPGYYIHVDYKSSKWPKGRREVDSDPQLWLYNWSLFEFLPQIDELGQIYEQLRYGQVPTRKTEKQRQQGKEWLMRQVDAILDDEDIQEDGLLEASYNQWCPWCPIMESCPVVPQLTDYATTRIAALQPMRPKTKLDGTPSKVMEPVPLDITRMNDYVAELERAAGATKVLTRFIDSVKALLRDMPEERRSKLGYALKDRKGFEFSAASVEELQERLGPLFYQLAGVTKTGLESLLSEDPELLSWALSLAEEKVGAVMVVPAKGEPAG